MEEETVYPAGRRYGEVAVTPLYDAGGGATHLIGIVHDITERKRLEESLRESEERLRLAMRSGNIGFWDWDVRAGELRGRGNSKISSAWIMQDLTRPLVRECIRTISLARRIRPRCRYPES